MNGILCAIAGAVALNVILTAFFRQLWFDEVISLMDFALLPNMTDIYRFYNIPNNHIVYNILLRWWIDACDGIPFLARLLPRSFTAITALASLALLLYFWLKRFHAETVFTAAFCLILSLPFAIYSTAVRGYMLSFLVILLSIEIALLYKEKKKPLLLAAYFLLSLIGSGTTPTNIVAFAAIYLFLVPPAGLKKIISDKTLLLALIPVATFLLFYVPIFPKLLKVLSLKEGWSSGFDASIHFYAAFIISFFPLLILAVAGKLYSKEKSPSTTNLLHCLIFLIPLIVFMIKAPAPFPRAFFCLWPLWIFMLCTFADPLIPLLKEKYRGPLLSSLICICVIWAAIPLNFPIQLSNALSKGGQDDFFKPYFMRPDFRPMDTVGKCVEISKEAGGLRVFLDFAADYPSLFFYARTTKMPEGFWIFDRPNKKVESLGNDAAILVVARSSSDMETIARRFSMGSFEQVADCGYQKIFLARLR